MTDRLVEIEDTVCGCNMVVCLDPTPKTHVRWLINEVKRLRGLVQQHITEHACLVCGSEQAPDIDALQEQRDNTFIMGTDQRSEPGQQP